MPRKKKDNAANEKKFILRFYRQFDIDLLYLYAAVSAESATPQEKAEEFTNLVRKAIRAYLRDSMRGRDEARIARYLAGDVKWEVVRLKKRLQVHVKFDKVDDQDIMDWIGGISKGYRNAAVKSVLRWYMGSPMLYPMLVTTDVQFEDGTSKKYSKKNKVESKEEVFRKDVG